jgi:hypothetical protein
MAIPLREEPLILHHLIKLYSFTRVFIKHRLDELIELWWSLCVIIGRIIINDRIESLLVVQFLKRY